MPAIYSGFLKYFQYPYGLQNFRFKVFKVQNLATIFLREKLYLRTEIQQNLLNTEKSFNKLKIHIIATRHEYGAIPC